MKALWERSYGLIGLIIIIILELIAFLGIPYANIWVTPFGWYGYILFFDWLVFRKKKSSLLMKDKKEFLLMFPISIILWSIFELHNLLIGNWEYIGLPRNIYLTLFAFVISFATILPAIYETFEFLRTKNLFNFKIRPHFYTKKRLIFEIIFGLVLIAIPTFFPSTHTGPLIWLGYLLVFVPLNYLMGIPSILKEREEGRLSEMLNLIFAGYICGAVWELLNYWAGAKWIYHVPYFPDIKFFEMPIIGFFGFGPFAIAFIEMYRFVRFLPRIIGSNPVSLTWLEKG